ncbi:MAG: PfkB family carbohydrate kinase [Patescibacteria group bacterium]|jgi:ribokinase
MKHDILTIGGATEDFSFYTHEGLLLEGKSDVLHQKMIAFEYGAKIGIDRVYSTYGGGAANTAVNLSGLGFGVAAVLAVGDDERGRNIINNLKQRKVSTDLVKVVKGGSTGFSFIVINKNNERIIFSNRGANAQLRLGAKDLVALKKSKWAYIASLSGPYWLEDLRQIFSVSSVKKIWNPGETQLSGGFKKISQFLKQTDIFCVNQDEAMELVLSTGKYQTNDFKFLNNVKNLLTVIKSFGPKMVIITSGKNGANFYDGNNFYRQAIIKNQKRLDTTGVGDAFHSSFLAGIEMYNGDIKKAMLLGAYNTAAVISEIGAQNGLLVKSDLKKYKL